MSDPLPPRRESAIEEGGFVTIPYYRWFEGVDRFIGTPPEEGSTGTVAAYDVGSSGARVPLLSGLGSAPNVWSASSNVFVNTVVTQDVYKVGNKQVVGPRLAAVADAMNAAAAPTQAEFNALVLQLNRALDRLRDHGLIEP